MKSVTRTCPSEERADKECQSLKGVSHVVTDGHPGKAHDRMLFDAIGFFLGQELG
jgi:hypothetical protein